MEKWYTGKIGMISMNEIDNFRTEVAANIEGLGQDEEIQKLSTSTQQFRACTI